MLKMDFDDFDIYDTASWPIIIKILALFAVAIVITMISKFLFIDGKLESLDDALREEKKLKTFIVSKQSMLVNIDEYKKQMDIIETNLTKFINLLPSDTEMPNLVNQISGAGKESHLVIKEVTVLPEKKLKYYFELPIKIKVYGSYHQIGEFMSKVSNLERILTLHDLKLKNLNKNDKKNIDINTNVETLELEMLAKIYRYNTGVEAQEGFDENTKQRSKKNNKKKNKTA